MNAMTRVGPVVITLLLGSFENVFADEPSFVPTSQYVVQEIEGWTVRVNRDLLDDERALGEEALRLLEVKLYDVSRVVPEPALTKLRQVPIWLGINDGHAKGAEYHPSRDWLAENGYNPDKVKSVEIGNAARFLRFSRTQPAVVLHELAHAYHDRVLGFDHPDVKAAHERAVASGRYDRILHASGRQQRAYALTNPQEFFAESSEAYFGTNDFYPFVRAELREFDPETDEMLQRLWTARPNTNTVHK